MPIHPAEPISRPMRQAVAHAMARGCLRGLFLVAFGAIVVALGYLSFSHPLAALVLLGVGLACLLVKSDRAWPAFGTGAPGWVEVFAATAVSWPALSWAYWERLKAGSVVDAAGQKILALSPGHFLPSVDRFLAILSTVGAAWGLLQVLLVMALARHEETKLRKAASESATLALLVSFSSFLALVGRGWALAAAVS